MQISTSQRRFNFYASALSDSSDRITSHRIHAESLIEMLSALHLIFDADADCGAIQIGCIMVWRD